MQDRQTEQRYHPREMLSLKGISSVLCVAPHPDDEVLGCGGLLALLQAQKAKVQVLVLTKGELGQAHLQVENQAAESLALAHIRVQESKAAAQVLGLPEPKFLNFKDRHLSFTDAVTQAIANHIQARAIDLLLLPSLSDPHPDHQAAALAGLAAVQNALKLAQASGQTAHSQPKAALERPLQILFYEVGAPLHANAFVDFTPVAAQKWAAVQSFKSQLSEEKYELLSRSMAAMRAFGLQPECTAAEAFFKVDMQAFMREGALAAMPQWPWVRHSLGLANAPEQMPLVSVLVRSMDRDCLPQALASVALQTYSNIELVVVNAKGGSHRPLSFLPQTLPCRLVNTEPASQTLSRPEAANLALQNAQGQMAIFLDDDDFFQPEHISQLLAILQDNPQAVGAYSGVRVDDQNGNTLREYNLPWSKQRLLAINFLPIHAVLFRMTHVRQNGLKFNVTLEVLEDWDFWLQLTQNSPLVHSPQITAVYRQALGKSELGNAEGPSHWKTWHHKILQKFVSQATENENIDVLSWYAFELDKQIAQSAAQELELKKQVAQLQAQAALDKGQIAQELAARLHLQNELEVFSAQTKQVFVQKELELQSHFQALLAQLAEKERQLQNHSEELHGLLAEKERQLQAFSLEAKNSLDTKELEKQSIAVQMQAIMQSKRTSASTFAAEVQKVLDAKDVEKQSFALQMQEIIHQKESQLQAIAADVQKTLDAKALESRELAASMIASVSGSILKADAIHQEVSSLANGSNPSGAVTPSALSQNLADHIWQSSSSLLSCKTRELKRCRLPFSKLSQALRLSPTKLQSFANHSSWFTPPKAGAGQRHCVLATRLKVT
jgi:LmbE family N-acetylglucosaminyl deacetylase